ncbi:MAG: phosphatidate cytidylyltransferase, partial [Solibacillus sp.]
MKQRIITGVIAAALFIPFVIYGGAPFALVVCALAIVGFYEILKMKGISIFSIPGILGVLALLLLVVPETWSAEGVLFLGYESKLMIVYGIVALLLMYIVLVKNKVTFDDIGFILLGIFYVGLG